MSSPVTSFAATMQGWTGAVSVNTGTWVNPNNAEANDSVYATVSLGGSGSGVGGGSLVEVDPADEAEFARISAMGGPSSAYTVSQYLAFSNFTFGVPTGATINGISVNLGMLSTEPSTCTISQVQLNSNSNTLIGSNLASSNSIASSETVYTFGGSTNLWGATLTPTVVNNSQFGFVLTVSCSDTTTAQTISCDYGTVTIYYSGGATGPTDMLACACEAVSLIPANFLGG